MKLRIFVKYCGGCNPGYDRVALAETIRTRLADVASLAVSASAAIDLVIAMQGCDTSCADLSRFKGIPVVSIAGRKDADRLIHKLKYNSVGHKKTQK